MRPGAMIRWMSEPVRDIVDPRLRAWQADADAAEQRAVVLRTARSKDAEEARAELEAEGISIESAGRRVVVAIVTPRLLDRAAAHDWVRAVQEQQEYLPSDLQL